MADYIQGEQTRSRMAFTLRALTPAERATFRQTGLLPSATGHDPDEVGCTIELPDGTATDLEFGTDDELVQVIDGSYYVDVDTTGQYGPYRVFWFSTGNGQAADEDSFDVAQR